MERAKQNPTSSGVGRSPDWLKAAGLGVATAAIVALLATVLFAALIKLPRGWRVAEAPSLAMERAVPKDEASRQSDGLRIMVP
jgi:hypothetical protein